MGTDPGDPQADTSEIEHRLDQSAKAEIPS